MMKGIKGFLKTPVGEYAFNFLFMGLFMSIALGLYDHFLNKPFEVLDVLLRFIISGLLGIILIPMEKESAEKKPPGKEKSDNSNN